MQPISNTPAVTQEGTAKNNTKQQNPEIAAGQQASADTSNSAHKAQLEAMELEIKANERRASELDLKLKKANLIDMEERLAERELKRENVRQDAYTKGATLADTSRRTTAHQNRCNHKKGGNGAQGVVGGQGDDSQYAVLKHTFANGDVWVACLRCHKKWKPPLKKDYKTEADFEAAKQVYREALNFQTRNSPSKGVIFQYSDGGQYYREQTANSI